jgi:hypothetical protein
MQIMQNYVMQNHGDGINQQCLYNVVNNTVASNGNAGIVIDSDVRLSQET